MLVDMVENAKKEKEEFFEKGVEKGKLEAAQGLLEMGDSVEKVAKALKWSIEKVQTIKNELKI